MSEIKIEEFRKKIDDDAGLRTKRNFLITASVILIAVNFSGAVVKEANTFLFNIEFTNNHGLVYALALYVFAMIFRYYAYAHDYHQALFEIWADKMLSDFNVFYFDPKV